jgi:hypothetical protein
MAILGLNNVKNLLFEFEESRKRINQIRQHFDYPSLKKVRMSVRDNLFSNFIRTQTPKQLGVWGKSAFVSTIRPDVDVVINRANPYLPLSSSHDKNWLLHIEPPGYIKKLGLATEKAVEKFGRVYTPAPHLYEKGGKFIASPPYVHWHLAFSSYTNNKNNFDFDYDFLRSQSEIPEKTVDLVTINSRINDLPGHKLRSEFISKISESFLDFELYGTSNWAVCKQYKGATTNGKWPIYSKSKYVLAIENEISDYYWTEKFTDAILCFSMPIYYGSPKIGNYFPEGSYIALDITKNSAIDDLRDILKSDFFERNWPNLLKARELILTRHNMFSFIDRELNN